MLPTFLILGAAKAGTTSLADYLSQHPKIYMSEPKEPSFFRLEYDRGLDFYRDTYFRGWTDETQVGEAAQRNLFLPYVPKRIFDALPEAKLIVLVRDPVERAFSHYLHDYQRGAYELSFEAAIEKDFERLEQGPYFENQAEYERILDDKGRATAYPTVLDSGNYAEQIGRYLEFFPRQQLQVILFEELITKTQSVLSETFSFLGVANATIGDTSAKNQQISKNAHKLMDLVGSFPGISRIPKHWKTSIKQLIRKRSAIEKPQMLPSTREKLQTYYGPHNDALSDLTGLDLSLWGRER